MDIKTIGEIDLTPKDQTDILKYISNIEDRVMCEELEKNMSTKAIVFATEIIEAVLK